jgi:hypothetical protein
MIRLHITALLLAILTMVPISWASEQKLSVRFDAGSRTLSIHDADGRTLLDSGIVWTTPPSPSPMRLIMPSRSDADDATIDASNPAALTITVPGGPGFRITATHDTVIITSTDPAAAGVDCRFAHPAGDRLIPAIAKDEQSTDRKVLITTLGPAAVPGARSLFDIQRDTLLSAAGSTVTWSHDGRWKLQATDDAKVALTWMRNYYRDALGIAYYTPIEKRSYWTTAPMACMTWYAICGEKAPQSLDLLKPEIDWAAKNLLPYAGRLVFQLDDNYDYRDDAKMRGLSDYIRSKGLIPGVWITPFAMLAPEKAQELAQTRPELFLRDDTGTILASFGGKNWGFMKYNQEKKWQFKGFSHTVDVRNPQAVEEIYKPAWQLASDTWNYDFFKIDGQNQGVIQGYKKFDGGIDAYRHGLDIARQVIGPDKFINACWGIPVPLETIGKVNGSRTGGDTGHAGHAGNVVVGHNYLNNVVWWSDPDAAAQLYNKPVENARINCAMRVLTGQQFLTDDYWTKVPAATAHLWQRSLPTLDITPVNLYPIGKDWAQYDLYNLRIARPWATWDIVGLVNYDKAPAEKSLDLSRLRLEADRVHLYEFFSGSYLGTFDRSATLTRSLGAIDAHVFAVVPAIADRPALLSTSRHISQGGADLAQFNIRADGKRWIVTGTSTHVVAGDPYELVFHNANLNATGDGRIVRDGAITRVTFTPDPSGSLNWSLTFAP